MKEKSLLEKAFDAEQFRSKGHDLVDQLADLLTQVKAGKVSVTEHRDPDELYQELCDLPSLDTSDFFKQVGQNCIKTHHPHYVGHQVAAAAPIAALSSLFDTFLNNGMGIYEMGEATTAIEKKVVGIFCRQIGYEDGDGVLTSGGTLANLTGLLAARAAIHDKQIWTEGTSEQYCILVSEMAHYCVDRAVRIMGWGSAGIVKVPVNDHYAMDTDRLEELYDKAQNEGKTVVAVVGSAPCTSTGSYDDLEAIASFCKQKNTWFHIDGAHGGPAIFSNKYSHLMKGSEMADSIVIDAHKMMLTPALATALLFKKASTSYQTFSQKADYLWEQQNKEEWFNLAKRSFECTKLAMGVRIMSIINEYGVEIFDQFLTRQYDLAKEFAQLVRASGQFELAVEPDSNIVCFRYLGDKEMSVTELSAMNRAIRAQMLDEGEYYLVQTDLKGQLFLRVTLMSPMTELKHLQGMMDRIETIGLKRCVS